MKSINGSVPIAAETMASYRQKGVSPLELWHGSAVLGSNFSTNALTVDTLFFMPFVVPVAADIDQIMFEVTTVGGAGAAARCGIYEGTSKTNIYPTKLVVDSGEIDTSGATGVKKTSISKTLRGDNLYWFAFVQKNTAPATTLRVVQPGGCWVLGLSPTLGASAGFVGLSVAFTYAALPDPAPASLAGYNGAVPCVAVRYVAGS